VLVFQQWVGLDAVHVAVAVDREDVVVDHPWSAAPGPIGDLGGRTVPTVGGVDTCNEELAAAGEPAVVGVVARAEHPSVHRRDALAHARVVEAIAAVVDDLVRHHVAVELLRERRPVRTDRLGLDVHADDVAEMVIRGVVAGIPQVVDEPDPSLVEVHQRPVAIARACGVEALERWCQLDVAFADRVAARDLGRTAPRDLGCVSNEVGEILLAGPARAHHDRTVAPGDGDDRAVVRGHGGHRVCWWHPHQQRRGGRDVDPAGGKRAGDGIERGEHRGAFRVFAFDVVGKFLELGGAARRELGVEGFVVTLDAVQRSDVGGALLFLALAVPGAEVDREGGDQQQDDHDQGGQDEDGSTFGAGRTSAGGTHGSPVDWRVNSNRRTAEIMAGSSDPFHNLNDRNL